MKTVFCSHPIDHPIYHAHTPDDITHKAAERISFSPSDKTQNLGTEELLNVIYHRQVWK